MFSSVYDASSLPLLMVIVLLHCALLFIVSFPSGLAVVNQTTLFWGLFLDQPSELRKAVQDTRLPGVCPPLLLCPLSREVSLQHKTLRGTVGVIMGTCNTVHSMLFFVNNFWSHFSLWSNSHNQLAINYRLSINKLWVTLYNKVH